MVYFRKNRLASNAHLQAQCAPCNVRSESFVYCKILITKWNFHGKSKPLLWFRSNTVVAAADVLKMSYFILIIASEKNFFQFSKCLHHHRLDKCLLATSRQKVSAVFLPKCFEIYRQEMEMWLHFCTTTQSYSFYFGIQYSEIARTETPILYSSLDGVSHSLEHTRIEWCVTCVKIAFNLKYVL